MVSSSDFVAMLAPLLGIPLLEAMSPPNIRVMGLLLEMFDHEPIFKTGSVPVLRHMDFLVNSSCVYSQALDSKIRAEAIINYFTDFQERMQLERASNLLFSQHDSPHNRQLMIKRAAYLKEKLNEPFGILMEEEVKKEEANHVLTKCINSWSAIQVFLRIL